MSFELDSFEWEVSLQPFRNLEVWRKAHALTLDLHRMTEHFPRAEFLGLGVQLRRLSSALAMKIAEACGRDHPSEFAQCLGQARGNGVEVEYALLLCRDLQLMPPEAHDGLQAQIVEIRRMLSGLMRSAGTAPFLQKEASNPRSILPRETARSSAGPCIQPQVRT